jgi:peptide maturation system protein (TIGR04066 family)
MKTGKKKKLIVYPFDREFSPILRHSGLLDEYDIAGAASLNGWGFAGEDAGGIDGGYACGLAVEAEPDKLLERCDAVLINDFRISVDFNRIIYPRIESAVKAGKDIICLKETDKDIEARIAGLCEAHGVSFTNYMKKDIDVSNTKIEVESLCRIETPVVFVLGLGENTLKFEIQLALRTEMLKKGYKISQIGSRNYCELLGFHSMPSFMHGNLTEAYKIVLFNNFVKKIELTEQPDIIIIGIPGGLMKINDEYTNKFGILAYEISQALLPDFAIFSTYYEDFKPEYFDMLANSARYKLGYEVDCFNLSNVQFDWIKAKASSREVYITLDSGFIDKKKTLYGNINAPVFNVLNRKDVQDISVCVEKKLQGYGQVASI